MVNPGEFELVHPSCVERVWDDYEEAMEVWRAGEPDEAREMLRFALEGCGDHAWVHCALGELALREEQNPGLARGHFGYVLERSQAAIPQSFRARLPESLNGNQPLYRAIDGLIACFRALGMPGEEQELLRLRAAYRG